MRERNTGPFKVFPANWTAVRWFMVSKTQLRASSGGVLGLDYPACDLARRLAGLPDPDAWDWRAFQVLEDETIAQHNKGAA